MDIIKNEFNAVLWQGAQAALAAFSQGKLVELVSKVALLAPVSFITSGPQFVYICSKIRIQKVLKDSTVILDLYRHK